MGSAAISSRVAALARNSQLLWTWDFLSLAICLDWAPCTAREVPTADQPADLELGAMKNEPPGLTLGPWPFAASTVTLRAEGRRLNRGERFETHEALASALDRAAWETLEFELRAAQAPNVEAPRLSPPA